MVGGGGDGDGGNRAVLSTRRDFAPFTPQSMAKLHILHRFISDMYSYCYSSPVSTCLRIHPVLLFAETPNDHNALSKMEEKKMNEQQKQQQQQQQ